MLSLSFAVLTLAIALGLLLVWKVAKPRISRHSGLPLPPGPPRLPLLGNARHLPTKKAWLGYDEWSKTYGSMVYVEAIGQPMLILHDMNVCNDLFDRRSSYYSSRPRMPMLRELMGWDWLFTLIPYGDDWRKRRKLFHQSLNVTQIHQFQPIQLRESRRMLVRLLNSPENFLHHVRHNLAASIMDVAYGIPVENSDNKYILKAEQAMDRLSAAMVPGKFMVDLFPFLKSVPAWVPGAGFKRKAEIWKTYPYEMITWPFDAVKQALSDGTAGPSLARSFLEQLPPPGEGREEAEVVARDVAGIAYAGGADTTLSAVQSFFMAMVLYPDVQRKAREELDRVVGSDRLPEFEDMTCLPYVNALCKEVMRWQPVTPLGAAHYVIIDDEYRGYRIPKGTIVIGNIWSMLRNPEDYPEPEVFRPERYLTKDGQPDDTVRDPTTISFGFGRRQCPGRWFSAQTLFAAVSSVLAVYDISPAVDAHGRLVQVRPEMSDGSISHPVPFKCKIEPRSEQAKQLVLDIGRNS